MVPEILNEERYLISKVHGLLVYLTLSQAWLVNYIYILISSAASVAVLELYGWHNTAARLRLPVKSGGLVRRRSSMGFTRGRITTILFLGGVCMFYFKVLTSELLDTKHRQPLGTVSGHSEQKNDKGTYWRSESASPHIRVEHHADGSQLYTLDTLSLSRSV